MNKDSPPDMAGMLGCDRELFSRVWARASTHDRETSPIEVLPPAPQVLPPPAPLLPQVDSPGNDELSPGDVSCLGKGGMDHTRFLQNSIRAELKGWRLYQFLSTRSSSGTARTLASMAADERRHAQRLSGAYFLISGIRFFPQTPPHRPTGEGFWSLVRQAFWNEQKVSSAYAAAAEETADPCLATLYRELAAEEAAHADFLRSMAEKMPMHP